jgi:hypothetical protein
MNKYNGWSNQETWLCHTHLTNDKYTYNTIEEMAKATLKESPTIFDAKNELASQLVVYCRSFLPSDGTSFAKALLYLSFNGISFYEIASNIIDSLKEES